MKVHYGGVKMPTDKQRMDFLERLVATQDAGGINLERSFDWTHSLDNPPERISVFTILSQHQDAKTAREAIDIAMKFESGERNWERENRR